MRVLALLQLLLVVATASGRPQSKVSGVPRGGGPSPPKTAESVRRGGRVQRIGVALAIDLFSAATCSAALSPAVAIIDKSIISNSAGVSESLGAAVMDNVATMMTAPVDFLLSPAVVLIFLVYLATYVAANLADTACRWLGKPPSTPKFIITTVVNVVAVLAKDAQFSRLFGTSKHAVPFGTYALFFARDAVTIYSSFVQPPQVAEKIISIFPRGRRPQGTALILAQLACPIIVQPFTGPLHLLGLDVYNRIDPVGTSSRLAAAFKDYFPVVGARMFRQLPAFGIGGVGNTALRNSLRKKVCAVRKADHMFEAKYAGSSANERFHSI